MKTMKDHQIRHRVANKKASINYQLFTQTSLDSGALTMLGTVIHNFSESGKYLGDVLLGKRTVGKFYLTVDKECPAMQVNIDLSMLHQPASKHRKIMEKRFVVNPKGYAVFHVSRGAGGYAVCVGRIGEKHESGMFDSRELKKDDLFAVTLIRPGTYSVTNVNTKAKSEIVVAYPKIEKIREPYCPPEPVSIECTKKAFEPGKIMEKALEQNKSTKKAFKRGRIEIKPAQGQVYRLKSPSRIKIRLVRPDNGPKGPRQPRITRWEKPADTLRKAR